MARAFSLRCAGFAHTCLVAAVGTLFSGLLWAQAPNKSYLECNHDSLITVLRAYEDSLALAGSTTVVRVDYAWRVTDVAVAGKVYKIYRCGALYDSLTVLLDAVEFARATRPVVDTDSISGFTSAAATFHAKVTSDGGEAVTAQWFRYGTSAGSLVDSVAVAGTATPFTGSVSTLTAGTTYYVAGFARNAKGTTPGDTLSFTTWAAPTVDTQSASSISATAATLSATFTDGGSAVTATGFKYATNAALTGATSVAGSGTTSPFTGSLTGLTASTQYWAVGYATNAVGTSYGDTITFTTSAPPSACGTSTVTYDGHNYTTVQIGSQCWFKENLRNDNYNDGTAIPGSMDNATWTTTTSGAQAILDADSVANFATYGRLYNWYAVNNAAGLCPTGWHVPTDAEWDSLTTFLGGLSGAGNAMKSTTGWPSGDGGTNSSGFSALPGGYRYGANGSFANQGSAGYWWSSSPSGTSASVRYLDSGYSSVFRSNASARGGFSVRCLQDAPPASSPTVDTQAANSLTATAATLNATFTDGGSAVTATGFKYATNSALTTPTDVAGSGTTSPFTAALTGLTASTQYWAVGYATNAVGTSYGDTITFTTSAPFACGTSTVTYDGHNYTTVQIGSQCWFKENLRNDNYNDGTAIPGNLNDATWTSTTSGAQTVYGQGGPNEALSLTTYGRLYNWYAVTDAAGLCPTGWHVPSNWEWTTLEAAVSSNANALKSNTGWASGDGGTNSSGFSALPGGLRNYYYGAFNFQGSYGYWWSSSLNGTYVWYRTLYSGFSIIDRLSDLPRYGFSVRCVQD